MADIARNTGFYLEIGTGFVDQILVLVPNDAGRFQVAKGAVYSYYEFWQPAELGRLTDEEWREMLLAGNAPPRPAWQDALFPGESAASGDCSALRTSGVPYTAVVAEFVAAGRPTALDPDGNGMPCEDEYPAADVDGFFGPVGGLAPGQFCRDIQPRGHDFASAVAYWLVEGAPDRMDADRNGIPCETIYPRAEIDAFFER